LLGEVVSYYDIYDIGAVLRCVVVGGAVVVRVVAAAAVVVVVVVVVALLLLFCWCCSLVVCCSLSTTVRPSVPYFSLFVFCFCFSCVCFCSYFSGFCCLSTVNWKHQPTVNSNHFVVEHQLAVYKSNTPKQTRTNRKMRRCTWNT